MRGGARAEAMFWNDIFERILDTFCNNNCDSSPLTRGSPTLAFFGRWPIYFTKWARYRTVLLDVRGRERDGGKGTNRGQLGVIAHSHCSCLTLSPTGHDYKALGDPSPRRPTVAACPRPSYPTLLSLRLHPSRGSIFTSAPLSSFFMFLTVFYLPPWTRIRLDNAFLTAL